MRKKLAVLVLAGMVILQGAVGSPLTDSFSFLNENSQFVNLVDAIKKDGNLDQACRIRDSLVSATDKTTEQTIIEIRSATLLSRLCVELPTQDDALIKSLLKEAEAKLKGLEDQRFITLILKSDIDAVWYLLNPRNLGKGISSSKQINKAYAEFPNEISSLLLKANSMLYAPSFAGGDIKKALNMYLDILKRGESILSPWDRSSLYSGIGIACYKLKDFTNAKGYLAAAKAMYPFDSLLDEYIALLEKEL